jgi:hypothetical protein
MKNQIKTEELAELKKLLTALKTIQDQLGLIEIQKHTLLHKYESVNQELNKLKSELQEFYGNVNINIEEGSYEKIKEDESDTKN